jgi:hypothetical protein
MTNFLILGLFLTGFFVSAQHYVHSQKNYVEIYVAPSAFLLDWSSPSNLYKTAQKSMERVADTGTPVGHVMMRIRCEDLSGASHDVLSAMNGDVKSLKRSMLLGRGLGVLLDVYPGHLMPQSKVRDFLLSHKGRKTSNGKLEPTRILRINVNASQCSDVMSYYQAFKNAKRLGFSLRGDPYDQFKKIKNSKFDQRGRVDYLEGGCSSFGTGALRVVGFPESIIKRYFIKEINISHQWIGDSGFSTNKIFSLDSDLKNGKKLSWVVSNIASEKLIFYDPEGIYQFIGMMSNNGAKKVSVSISGKVDQEYFQQTLEGVELINNFTELEAASSKQK